MKKNIIIASLLMLIVMTSSTVYARYKSDSLKKVQKRIDISTQESLSFDYKVLNSKDCKKYFNSKSIIKKGYQPIQVTFTNNSKSSIAISPESFSFRSAHAQDVANSLHRDGAARGVGFGIGSLFCTWLVIPALVQGLGANNYNDDMDIDFERKSFKNRFYLWE